MRSLFALATRYTPPEYTCNVHKYMRRYILENQLRAITPELMAGSTPNFNHMYTIYWGYFTVSSQEVSTMALAISYNYGIICCRFRWKIR
jgi:hypothetical protein